MPKPIMDWTELDRLLPKKQFAEMGEWGNDATQAWMGFRKNNPKTALALSVLPVTGQLSAVAELNDANQRGDVVDGALAGAQLLPFGGMAKAGRLAVDAARLASFGKATRSVVAGSGDIANTLQYIKDSK